MNLPDVISILRLEERHDLSEVVEEATRHLIRLTDPHSGNCIDFSIKDKNRWVTSESCNCKDATKQVRELTGRAPKKNMKILAFYGQQQVGKSSAAAAVGRDNHLVVQASFADPIYRAVSAILGFDVREVEKETPILCDKSPRQLLQTLGTEWGRGMVGDDIWLKCMEDTLITHQEAGKRMVVIDDLRFRNEYEFLRGMGATIVRVDRPGLPVPEGRSHPSERDWPEFEPDLTLLNDSRYLSEWKTSVHNAIQAL